MNQKVELTPTTQFRVSDKEFLHMYTVLALSQYSYNRKPDYGSFSKSVVKY